MSSAIGILSASILLPLLAPSVHAQATGTVSIDQLAAWNNAPSDAKLCLWEPSGSDVASTLGCPSPTLNVCYCPTGAASSTVLNVITTCMTYWFSDDGILQVPTAVSVYSQYCQGAVGASITTGPTATNTSPSATSSPTAESSSKLDVGGITGIICAVCAVLGLAIALWTDRTRKWLKKIFWPGGKTQPAHDSETTYSALNSQPLLDKGPV